MRLLIDLINFRRVNEQVEHVCVVDARKKKTYRLEDQRTVLTAVDLMHFMFPNAKTFRVEGHFCVRYTDKLFEVQVEAVNVGNQKLLPLEPIALDDGNMPLCRCACRFARPIGVNV